MSEHLPKNVGELTLSEMREFATFSAREQRYIRRSIDIALDKKEVFTLWARDREEEASIREQRAVYSTLGDLCKIMPEEFETDMIGSFLAPLISLTAFDLAQEHIICFCAYRFLYERLFGALVRPWLPSAFCAAAAMPNLEPEYRKQLLQSISQAAATAPGWSELEPVFVPEWVEKVSP